MYYIKQIEGKLNDMANELTEAVKRDDIPTAARIFREATGREGSQPETRENVWWIYNAADCIRNHCGDLTTYARFPGQEDYEKLARVAAAKLGGKWKVIYEY